MLLLLNPKNEPRPSPSTKLTCKDSAKGRQHKIKKELFIFLLLRCSLSYQKIVQKIDLAKEKRIFFLF